MSSRLETIRQNTPDPFELSCPTGALFELEQHQLLGHQPIVEPLKRLLAVDGVNPELGITTADKTLRAIETLCGSTEVKIPSVVDFLRRIKQELVLDKLEAGGFFEGLDLPKIKEQTGFTKKDVTVMLATVSPDNRQAVIDALNNFAALRQDFFENPQNAEIYQFYNNCLLTLIYGDRAIEAQKIVGEFVAQSDQKREGLDWVLKPPPTEEEKGNQVFYELYVDLYGNDFAGLAERLENIKRLGITKIWVLPFLESGGVDAGYDVKDRKKVAEKLGGNEQFLFFLQKAREMGMTIMTDMVLNHISSESDRFKAFLDGDSAAQEWFITREFDQNNPGPPADFPAYVIFGGMVAPTVGEQTEAAGKPKVSNWSLWTKNDGTKVWVYNRFLAQMPDVNFKNPAVLREELEITRHWIDLGGGVITDIRHDALVHVWREDGKSVNPDLAEKFPELRELVESYGCDNLPQARIIEMVTRGFLEHRYKGHVSQTAEVWQEGPIAHRYWGPQGEAANNQFGFTLMDAYFQSLVQGEAHYLYDALALENAIPGRCGSITPLRHHDSTSGTDTGKLSQVARRLHERLKIPKAILRKARQLINPDITDSLEFAGGFATRLSDFLEAIAEKKSEQTFTDNYALAMSLLMFTSSRPLIYMGDEWAQPNLPNHLLNVSKKTGGWDLRHVFRNIWSWKEVNRLLQDPNSRQSVAKATVMNFIDQRRRLKLGTSKIESLSAFADGKTDDFASHVFAARRVGNHQSVLMVANLSQDKTTAMIEIVPGSTSQIHALTNAINGEIVTFDILQKEGREFLAIELTGKKSVWLVQPDSD